MLQCEYCPDGYAFHERNIHNAATARIFQVSAELFDAASASRGVRYPFA
jgi:hypothetical protein